jgi:hypothetical protein
VSPSVIVRGSGRTWIASADSSPVGPSRFNLGNALTECGRELGGGLVAIDGLAFTNPLFPSRLSVRVLWELNNPPPEAPGQKTTLYSRHGGEGGIRTIVAPPKPSA